MTSVSVGVALTRLAEPPTAADRTSCRMVKAAGGTQRSDPSRWSKKTTADYFAEALSHCGEGIFVPLDSLISIMHQLGWTTESGSRVLIRRNVHSRVYKHMRHTERHPEDALPIDDSKSRLGLYAYRSRGAGRANRQPVASAGAGVRSAGGSSLSRMREISISVPIARKRPSSSACLEAW